TSSHDDRYDTDELDAELERLLAGTAPSADAPAWCGDVALLVRAARAPARDDELAREAETVARMSEIRRTVLAEGEVAAGSPADPAVPTLAATSEAAGGAATRPEMNAPAKPVNGTPAPVNGTAKRVNGSAPVDGTAKPVNGTAKPTVNGTPAPVNGATKPVNGSAAPVNGTPKPVNGTAAPGHGAAQPGADGQPAVSGAPGPRGGTPKIGLVTAAAEPEPEATPEPPARTGVGARLRALATPVDLDDYRAKHGGERYYIAKHAAARLENSKYPLARTVGRVVAIKAGPAPPPTPSPAPPPPPPPATT